MNVYVHDGKTTLIEVKSYSDLDDMEWFFEKAGMVERILGRSVDKLVLVAVNIDEDVFRRARKLGIDVIYGSAVA